jgi:hypothetical protein
MNLESQPELVNRLVVVAVFEDIGGHFLNGQVGDINRLASDAAVLKELHGLLRGAAEVGQTVAETSLENVVRLSAHQHKKPHLAASGIEPARGFAENQSLQPSGSP